MGYELARLNHGKKRLDALDYAAGVGLVGSAIFGTRFGYEYLTRSWEDIDSVVSTSALVSALTLIGAFGALAIVTAASPRRS